jgi:phosphoenolpyruvate---glycerone phosphotransferase subunit DhaL
VSAAAVEMARLNGVVLRLNDGIVANKAWLSEVDGAIGDGDHGINMAKGFSIAAGKVSETSPGYAAELAELSRVLMTQIGGSMGPLYGMFFKAMAEQARGFETVGLGEFHSMVAAAHAAIRRISPAKQGDKTLMDCLEPALASLQNSVESGSTLQAGLQAMKAAAEQGRDATRDLVARLGRSSRLGERSRGVLDAGACSCCLILTTLADQLLELANDKES